METFLLRVLTVLGKMKTNFILNVVCIKMCRFHLDVKKSMKHLNVRICQYIEKGRKAKVYWYFVIFVMIFIVEME